MKTYKVKVYIENITLFHILHAFELTKKDFQRKTNISKNFDYQFLMRLYGENQIKKVLDKKISSSKYIEITFNDEKILEINPNFPLKKSPETNEEKYLISRSSCCFI